MKKNNCLHLFFKLILSAFLFELLVSNVNAQNTFPSTGSAGIGTTTPNASAKLEIKSTTKGFLGPRMTQAQRNAISSPATGLMIYQTDNTPGFYYYIGSAWKAVTPAASGWSLKGNAGTDTASNFIGTKDAKPLLFKVNSIRAGYLDYAYQPGAPFATGNTSFGYQALIANTTGFGNVSIGYNTLIHNAEGYYNSAIGNSALYKNTSGSFNTAHGYEALYNNTTGSNNTAVGEGALANNTTAISNTATGERSLYSNTTGHDNAANGNYAMYFNATGNYNTANGSFSFFNNTTGSNNTGNGYNALYSNETGNNNTANGYQALYFNSSASNSTATGVQALYSNTTGDGNTATGAAALYSNSTGANNTATGWAALPANSSGSDNTATGTFSLNDNMTGSFNTAYGYTSLSSNVTGLYNTAVGYSADVIGNQSNATAIGYAAGLNISNGCVIGNASVSLIGGVVGWSTLSDGRFKRNLQNNVPGLSFITQLKPVTYTLDIKAFNKFSGADDRMKQVKDRQKKDKSINTVSDAVIDNAIKQKESILYTGFVAQEVEQAATKSGYNFSGIHKPQNDKDNYSLDYSSFVVPLVKAVQELSAKNDDFQKQIDDLKAMIVSGSTNSSYLKTSGITTLTGASLEQNKPNPYKNNTTISYTLPQRFITAQIIITDKSGKTLKHISVSGSGKGSLNVDAAILASGAYNYSLFVDSKLIATKQMELVKY